MSSYFYNFSVLISAPITTSQALRACLLSLIGAYVDRLFVLAAPPIYATFGGIKRAKYLPVLTSSKKPPIGAVSIHSWFFTYAANTKKPSIIRPVSDPTSRLRNCTAFECKWLALGCAEILTCVRTTNSAPVIPA